MPGIIVAVAKRGGRGICAIFTGGEGGERRWGREQTKES
jgi:hypothetical protein